MYYITYWPNFFLFQTKAAKQQLTELQDRHDEFIKLERSIKEVHDMFIEIGNLVTTQVQFQAERRLSDDLLCIKSVKSFKALWNKDRVSMWEHTPCNKVVK